MNFKFTDFKNKFENLPIALAGISLGFMSIATSLTEFNIIWVRHIAVLFSVLCLLFLLIKLCLYPKKVFYEIKNPTIGAIYPTVFMTLMLISVYLVKINLEIARTLWLISIILHFIIFIIFGINMIKDFNIKNMIPSWFIPTIGIGLAAVTSKPMNMPNISKLIFYYSLVWFIILFPIMIYRILFKEKINGVKEFTLMIMLAPSNICLAGYFAVSDKPNFIFITILASISYIALIYGYAILPKFIKQAFTPACAPITFPLGISVVASQRFVNYMGKIGNPLEYIFKLVLYMQVTISLIVILYVVIKTVGFILKSFNLNILSKNGGEL